MLDKIVPLELQSFVRKYPEYEPVIEAMCQYQAGMPITACCPKCGKALSITDLPYSRWVTCEKRCTSVRFRYSIPPTERY